MVTAATTLPGNNGTLVSSAANKLKHCKKAMGLSALVGGAMCIFDFMNVPGAFKLEYDKDGNKIEGTSTKQGLKELGKSALRCASYFVVPALIGLLPGAGIAAMTAKAVAGFTSSFALSGINEKILPTEQRIVEEACLAKGIDYKPFSESNGVLA